MAKKKNVLTEKLEALKPGQPTRTRAGSSRKPAPDKPSPAPSRPEPAPERARPVPAVWPILPPGFAPCAPMMPYAVKFYFEAWDIWFKLISSSQMALLAQFNRMIPQRSWTGF